jgi:HAD superfamily hydrolase (TIGR01509 family)
MSHRAVLFDMDGVLVDSEHYWVEWERESLLPETVPDHEVSISEITGMNYREIYDYLADHYDVAVSKDEWIARYDEASRTVYEQADLLPVAEDLLAVLREREITTAVVSSSPRDWIRRALSGYDLEFDAYVSVEDIDSPGKPAPDVFEHAAGKLGVEPEECLVVEDSENGVESAVAAGATVIGYRSGADDVDLSAADAVVDSPSDLFDAILERV